MFKQGAAIKAVKEKSASLPWLKLTREKHFESGETNLYYDDRGDTVVMFFNSDGKYIDGERITVNEQEYPLF